MCRWQSIKCKGSSDIPFWERGEKKKNVESLSTTPGINIILGVLDKCRGKALVGWGKTYRRPDVLEKGSETAHHGTICITVIPYAQHRTLRSNGDRLCSSIYSYEEYYFVGGGDVFPWVCRRRQPTIFLFPYLLPYLQKSSWFVRFIVVVGDYS